MPEAQNTVTIDRPRDEVFDFVSNHENDSRWRQAVLEVERVSGEGGSAHYRQVVRGPGGRGIPADFEITEFEPGRRIGFKVVAGPLRPEGRYEFADAGSGTQVTFSLRADLPLLKKAMAPMVSKAMQSEVQELDRLKELLERT